MTETVDTTNVDPGDCPRCDSFDDDLSFRNGICETCWREEQALPTG